MVNYPLTLSCLMTLNIESKMDNVSGGIGYLGAYLVLELFAHCVNIRTKNTRKCALCKIRAMRNSRNNSV